MNRRVWVGSLAGVVLTATAASAAETATHAADVAGTAASGTAASGGTFLDLLFVFILATFIGLGVITRVSRLLHTPLMSLTNAISAIAIVGSLVIAGQDHPPLINLLGAVAIAASMTNIVSGFLITDRMLKMFKQQERQPK
jgi:NAD(P) transhydrogenase subunit alpha